MPNLQNHVLLRLIIGQIQKTSRYFLSKQEGTEEAKKISHATVPLRGDHITFHSQLTYFPFKQVIHESMRRIYLGCSYM
jgi:hypothetical protein